MASNARVGGGPRTTPPLGCTRYRDNLSQDQARSLDDNFLSANQGHILPRLGFQIETRRNGNKTGEDEDL